MTSRTSWTIVDEGARPLTINAVAKLHRREWARHTAAARTRWAWLARAARIPHLNTITIDVTPLHATNASPQDIAACAPETKAAVDGLRDAEIISDDTADIVTLITFHPPRRNCGTDGLELTITKATR